MNQKAGVEQVEALLIGLGVLGPPLEAIMALIRCHASADRASQVALAVSKPGAGHDLGTIAADFLKGSLRRKDLLGPAADDPSWNMMLALFADERNGQKTSMTSACHASGAAPTTALRHLDHLIRSGLVERTSDWRDRRRSFLSLTPSTEKRMAELVRSFCIAAPATEPSLMVAR